MARKRRFKMSSTGPDVSNFPRRGRPLHAEDTYSEPFWKRMKGFFQNDPVLFEDLKREVEDEPATLISLPGSSQTGEAKLIWSKLPLARNLSSAFIDENDSKETNREMYDRPQDVFFRCTCEDSPHGNCTQIESDTENAGKVELEIEQEEYRGLDERHAQGGQQNRGKWQSSCQICGLISSISVKDTPYQEMNLDQRILLELQSIGMFQETVPDPAQNEDEVIKPEMCNKDELQNQVSKNKCHFHKVEKAVFKGQKVEDRECEVDVMNTLVESACNRHIGGRGVRWVPGQQLAVRPVLPGPQIRPLGQPQAQHDRDRQNAALQVQVAALQEQLDRLHIGTNSITTTKVRRSRTTKVRRRTSVWGSATGGPGGGSTS